MAGRQCEKRLWLEAYRSHLIEYGSDVEQRFAAGDKVNDIARAQYPDGVLVSYDHGANAAVEETLRLLSEQLCTPIFEATFKAHDVLVRVDILKPCHEGFELIEIKSSTSVKGHHYADSAVQTWVLECAGIPVKAIYLCHIDNQFVYPENGDYRGMIIRVTTSTLRPSNSRFPSGKARAPTRHCRFNGPATLSLPAANFSTKNTLTPLATRRCVPVRNR